LKFLEKFWCQFFMEIKFNIILIFYIFKNFSAYKKNFDAI